MLVIKDLKTKGQLYNIFITIKIKYAEAKNQHGGNSYLRKADHSVL